MSVQTEQARNRVVHPFDPVYNENSTVLILGSFPSVKSREQLFYYGHPQNRFWRVIASVFREEIPVTIQDKRWLILNHRLALWDSIASCEIIGSSDASIRSVRANDLSVILNSCRIRGIYCNGRKSHELFCKYIQPAIGRTAVCLPSTSPANARWSLDALTQAWSVLRCPEQST